MSCPYFYLADFTVTKLERVVDGRTNGTVRVGRRVALLLQLDAVLALVAGALRRLEVKYVQVEMQCATCSLMVVKLTEYWSFRVFLEVVGSERFLAGRFT